jgi:hypothetical protein
MTVLVLAMKLAERVRVGASGRLQQPVGQHPLSSGGPPTALLQSSGYAGRAFNCCMRDLDPTQYGEADRRELDPPLEVGVAIWSVAGTLDWWVRDRREWFGRVRGKDGKQRWIKAADPSPGQGR